MQQVSVLIWPLCYTDQAPPRAICTSTEHSTSRRCRRIGPTRPSAGQVASAHRTQRIHQRRLGDAGAGLARLGDGQRLRRLKRERRRFIFLPHNGSDRTELAEASRLLLAARCQGYRHGRKVKTTSNDAPRSGLKLSQAANSDAIDFAKALHIREALIARLAPLRLVVLQFLLIRRTVAQLFHYLGYGRAFLPVELG
jgi:hypothetical protein